MTTPEVCKKCGKLAFPGETVTIPAGEYEELRRFKADRTPVQVKIGEFRHLGRGRISRDPELAEFLVANVETMRLADLHEAALHRFGAERVPHRTTIYRFLFGYDDVRGGGAMRRRGG